MTPTPKEKADDLVAKFSNAIYEDMYAKDCAIIAVNEVIEVIDDFEFSNHGKIGNNYGQKFWYEVKEELEKIIK